MIPESVIEKFHTLYVTVPESGCWIWLSANRNCYGRIYFGGRRYSAHRISYEIHKGVKVPEDMLACHKCDTRCCVNPDHLFIGTNLENMQDMVRKGRNRHWRPVGRKSRATGKPLGPKPKLSSEDVRNIRQRWESGDGPQSKIARDYGVAQSLISRICTNQARTRQWN